ncbi:MAG: hypothetical protein EBZ69_00890 [Alphaproteobacteria bacterium]|nr:hypothetical protein [Alphaproteobacteria bacterium]
MTNQDLLNELLAMRELGIPVSDGTLNHAREDDISTYVSISVSDLASLFCELYNFFPGSELWQRTTLAIESDLPPQ